MSTRILHVDLVQQHGDAYQLRLWREGATGSPRTRTLSLEPIRALLDRAETDYYHEGLSPRLVQIGRALYDWLNGGEQWLANELRALRDGASVVLLSLTTAEGLAHLPWEVLHDGHGFLVLAASAPVVPVRGRLTGVSAHPGADRPLRTLFMASSPDGGGSVLDYEREEAAILAATDTPDIELVVEESGWIEELSRTVTSNGDGHFDVLHLTGHAGHTKDGDPIFQLEDAEGQPDPVTPARLADAVAHRPTITFLSGCRTAQDHPPKKAKSFAAQLRARGFRVVLGWGRKVLDGDATSTARALYEDLSSGLSLPQALARTYRALHGEKARDWHLLRVFCEGEMPGPLVLPRLRRKPQPRKQRLAEAEFLDPLTREVRVATRERFVGRRRLLQRSLRVLRRPPAGCVGVLLHGQGGRGKSSAAARLCDRLRDEFQRIVVFGRLDEFSLAQAWERHLPSDAARRALRDADGELRYRLIAAKDAMMAGGKRAPLFVLDDCEQNQPNAERGDLSLEPEAARVLLALCEALEQENVGAILMTCRYALPEPFARYLVPQMVAPLDGAEQDKQLRRLTEGADDLPPDLLARARKAADGNPRLLEWLIAVLQRKDIPADALLAEMEKVESEFRANILAAFLLDSRPLEDRVLLGRLLRVELPVPLAAVQVLDDRPAAELPEALAALSALGLLDVTPEEGAPHYRVPRQLASDPPLVPLPQGPDRRDVADRLLTVLYAAWWTNLQRWSEPRGLTLIDLAQEAERATELVDVAGPVASWWHDTNRYREIVRLLSAILAAAGRHPVLLARLAIAMRTLGDAAAADVLLDEAVRASDGWQDRFRADVLHGHSRRLSDTGRADEMVRLLREELLPLEKALGREHEYAVASGYLADVLASRGEVEEALRIRREEVLPVYEALGDVRSRAVTLGKIADVLASRGEVEEALRILREDVLPVFEALGDVRERAVTRGRIADVLASRGEVEEALRIRREEQLPVYEALEDVRSRAVTLGRIAGMLTKDGNIDEAIRICAEEELPVYMKLRATREIIVGRVNLALLLLQRGRQEDARDIVEHLLRSYVEAAKRGYIEAEQIAGIMQQLGLPLPELSEESGSDVAAEA